MSIEHTRRHTGRRRNEAARQAILTAAVELLGRPDVGAASIDTIAAAAGVGKQTIYRWWPSKGAVLLEAMIERANMEAPTPDTGCVLTDLTTFLTAVFTAVHAGPAAAVLRAVMAEAQHNQHAAELFGEFTAHRRAALRSVLEKGVDRGELAADADLDLVVDQAFGVLWYRMLTGHGELTAASASRLAAALVRQAAGLE
jgi:AcrR family transcriptional regulator